MKEGLALDSVPRASYLFGFAGTIPYLSTALASLYLTWNLSTPWPTDSNLLNSFLMSHETAHYLLALLEPIQIGYGAVILTFLGAVHWGLELGEKAPAQPRTKFRYAMGLAAPVLAWPTIMLPMQWAMITQFFGFVSLYFADARSTTRGWTPHWYTTYRFVLTAIVGASIVVTLIARASIDNAGSRLTTEDLRHVSVKDQAGPQEYRKWAELEEKERQRLRKEKEKKRAEEEQKKAEEEKEQKGRENKGKDKKHERDEAEEGGEKKSTEQEVDADQKTVQGKDQQKSKDDGGTEAEKKEEKD